MYISYDTAFLCSFWMHILESMCVFLNKIISYYLHNPITYFPPLSWLLCTFPILLSKMFYYGFQWLYTIWLSNSTVVEAIFIIKHFELSSFFPHYYIITRRTMVNIGIRLLPGDRLLVVELLSIWVQIFLKFTFYCQFILPEQ